jgi:hypothetical protein
MSYLKELSNNLSLKTNFSKKKKKKTRKQTNKKNKDRWLFGRQSGGGEQEKAGDRARFVLQVRLAPSPSMRVSCDAVSPFSS